MKILFLVIMASILAIGLTGCGLDPSTKTTSTAPATNLIEEQYQQQSPADQQTNPASYSQ
jgi:uncharacterized lipoprotein YehR (DUF1307 family)